MSVNTVNKSDGSLQKVAGKIASGTLVPSVSYYQSGQKTSDTTSWSTGETGTFSISLSEDMNDTDYVVVPTLSVTGVSASVHSKTSNSFKVTVRNDRTETIAQAITLYWQAFRLMTNEQHTLDEQSIAKNTSDISDLQDDKQDKTLETPLTIGGTSRTTVEGALGGLNGVIPSDASASNKLITRRCIRYDNASDLENAIINLPAHSQLDFVAISAITIGGVTLPQYTAWHIYRDSKGLACIGGVGYSYLDGSCYKINGSIDSPKVAGLSLAMQKLVTESDLTSRDRKTRRQLSASDLTALKTAIKSGNFGDINIKDGDYFSGASGLKYTLGEFNHFKGSTTQYSVIADNHYAIVVDCMATTPWNSAGDATGAYKASTLRTYLTETALPKVLSDMQALGFTVISRQCLESNAFDSTGVNRCGKATGCSSGWDWVIEQIIALSEPQVYGSVVAGSSFYDVGEANRQLNCFKEHSFMDIADMKYFWLKGPSSSGSACNADGNRGHADGTAGVTFDYSAFGLIVIK